MPRDMCGSGLTSSQTEQLVSFLDLARPSAHRFARRLGLSAEYADEALHDFAARLVQQPQLIDCYNYPQKLVSVHRKLINEAHRAHRHIGLDDALFGSDSHIFLVASDPIQQLAAEECLDQLRQLATQHEQYILDLVGEGFTIPEIAQVLGVTVQAVHNAVYRLRRRWSTAMGSNGTASMEQPRKAKGGPTRAPQPRLRDRSRASA